MLVRTGAATVMVTVALTLPDEAVITAVPGAAPVTRPVLLTVATFVALDDQAMVAAMAAPFWSFGAAASCSVEPATTLVPPLRMIEVSTGTAVTVMVVFPFTLPAVAVITAVPGATPVTTPLLFTVAMFVAPDDQLTVAAMALPFWSLGLATSAIVAPTATVGPPDTEIEVSTGAGVGVGVVGELLPPPPEQPRSETATATTIRER